MSEHNAKYAREKRLIGERREKVDDRAIMLAIMGAFLYPTQGDNAIHTASWLIDDAKKRAAQDIPEVEL